MAFTQHYKDIKLSADGTPFFLQLECWQFSQFESLMRRLRRHRRDVPRRLDRRDCDGG